MVRHIGCTTREPSKTLATVPETRRSEAGEQMPEESGLVTHPTARPEELSE
jgi:hypothetical protein